MTEDKMPYERPPRLLCPLRHGPEFTGRECYQERCAWWVNCCCAVFQMATCLRLER